MGAPAFAVPPGPPANPFPDCPNLGYQFQSQDGTTSNYGNFDLNTATLFSPLNIGPSVNALGYSFTDRVFWGMLTNPPVYDLLVRIDRLGVETQVGQIDWGAFPKPPSLKTNTGTVSHDNYLYLHTKEPLNHLIKVDVDTTRPTFGQVVADIPLKDPGGPAFLEIGDWDFNADTGLLYSLEMQGSTKRIFVSINPADGQVTRIKDLSDRLPDGLNYGAVYVEDFSGTVYFSNNDINGLGQRSQTFGYYPDLDIVIPYTPGVAQPALKINDAADCLVATDFGDAPDSYGTLNPHGGPGHIFTEVVLPGKHLRIGALIDPDLDGIPTAGADGDDKNLPTNDEDGVAPGTLINLAQPTLTVPVTNTTGTEATLAGWVDFNQDGKFDDSERAITSVPAAGGNIKLTWASAAGADRNAYLRLRLYPGVEAAPVASGGAPFVWGGEIEDHQVGLTTLTATPVGFPPAPPTGQLPVTGGNTGTLIKIGALFVLCGGFGYLVGGRPCPTRRPSPRHR